MYVCVHIGVDVSTYIYISTYTYIYICISIFLSSDVKEVRALACPWCLFCSVKGRDLLET